MSILRSARNAITGMLDTVTDVAKGAQETVGMGTQYVHHRSLTFKESDRENAALALSENLRAVKAQLDADPELAAIHEAVMKKFGW